MIGHLYRYQHPNDSAKFVYVGQGRNRDAIHRSGKTSFGRRFKRDFPSIELSQPIREQIHVSDQQELNDLETIWMFRFHTWRGYPGGMNLVLPRSTDYKILGQIGGAIRGPIQGRKNLENGHWEKVQKLGSRLGVLKQAESGHCARIAYLGGKVSGRIAVESGRLASYRTQEHQSAACRKRNEMYGNPATPEGCAKGGHVAGLINGPIQGRIQGAKNAENGHMSRLGGSGIGLCFRWNIRRNKPCTCGKHLLE